MRPGHLALAALVVACRPAPPAEPTAVEPQGESMARTLPDRVPARYAFLYDMGLYAGTEDEVLAAALPYERIELERSGCLGTCAAFLLQLTRDGTANWEGEQYSEPGGKCSGRCGLDEFGRICWYVEKLGLERMAGKYQAMWTDDQTTTIRLVKPDGQTIEFVDYGRQAPIEILSLADQIERIALQNGWAREVEGEVSIDAVVLDVNRELERVTLDKGLRDGMRVGYAFRVFGSEYKGTVRIEEVQDTTSSGRIFNDGQEISPGDKASMEF